MFEKPSALVRSPRTEAAQAPQVMFGTEMLFRPPTALFAAVSAGAEVFGNSELPAQPARATRPSEQSLRFMDIPIKRVMNRGRTSTTISNVPQSRSRFHKICLRESHMQNISFMIGRWQDFCELAVLQVDELHLAKLSTSDGRKSNIGSLTAILEGMGARTGNYYRIWYVNEKAPGTSSDINGADWRRGDSNP